MSTDTITPAITIRSHSGAELDDLRPRLEAFVARHAPLPLSYHPSWASALANGLGHAPYLLEAEESGTTRGLLPLALVRGPLFGRFLVGLPYLNYGGPLADDDAVARLLASTTRSNLPIVWTSDGWSCDTNERSNILGSPPIPPAN